MNKKFLEASVNVKGLEIYQEVLNLLRYCYDNTEGELHDEIGIRIREILDKHIDNAEE